MDKLPILNPKLISPFTPGASPTARRIPTEWYHKGVTHISISGPRNSGKSVITCAGLILNICLRNPKTQARVIRKEASSLWDSLIYPVFHDDVLAEGLYNTRGIKFTKKPYEMNFANGSRITFGGFGGSDAAGKVLGGKCDIVWYNQIEREDDIENYTNLIGCMAEGRGGNLFINGQPHFLFIGDLNPTSPKHWWYQMRHDPNMLWYNLFHHDHPLFRDFATGGLNERGESLREQLKMSTPEGWMQDRMVDGLFVGAAGRIYPMISEDNVKPIAREDIPDDWVWVAGLDFGKVDPNVCDYWAFSPDKKKAKFYKSIYRSNILTRTFADMIRDLENKENIKPKWRVADHDSQLAFDLQDLGIDTTPAIKNDIPSDLEHVRHHLHQMEVEINENLLYHDPCQFLINRNKSTDGIEEILDYAHKEEKDQKGNGKDDFPADGQDDHSMDTMKYIFRFHLDDSNMLPSFFAPLKREVKRVI